MFIYSCRFFHGRPYHGKGAHDAVIIDTHEADGHAKVRQASGSHQDGSGRGDGGVGVQGQDVNLVADLKEHALAAAAAANLSYRQPAAEVELGAVAGLALDDRGDGGEVVGAGAAAQGALPVRAHDDAAAPGHAHHGVAVEHSRAPLVVGYGRRVHGGRDGLA